MSIYRPCEAGDYSASNFRRAICGLMTAGFLAVQPSDTTLHELPEEKSYDYLFDGIEIIREPAEGQRPEDIKENDDNAHDKAIPDDPACTPDTCIVV